MRASVVVLNYNSGDSIDSCVEKLLVQEGVDDYEVVVVDNASTDGSGDRIAREYGGDPRFRLVRSPRNLGCAGGRNLGIAETRGALVAFVDSDAWAEAGWLAGVLAEAERGAGVVASKLVYARNPLLLNGLGGTMNLQGYAWDVAFGEPVETTALPATALYACGNGLSVRRAVIESVGGFDASYFNYYEDVDFCLRARRAGFGLALASGAALHHYMGASDALNRNKLFLCERNRCRTVLRNFPRAWLGRWLARERRWSQVPNDLVPISIRRRAWFWNVLRLPALFAWRAGPGRGLAPLAVESLLEPYWGYGRHRGYNLELTPDRDAAGPDIAMGERGEAGLLYGWFYAEKSGESTFRWSDGDAACLVRAGDASSRVRIEYCWPSDECAAGGAELELRSSGGGLRSVQLAAAPRWAWTAAELEIGPRSEPLVELRLRTRAPLVVESAVSYRRLGIGVRRIETR